MNATETFLRVRNLLFEERENYEAAMSRFAWPALSHFNWALDWFDVQAQGNTRTALWIADDEGHEVKSTFAELSEQSNRLANVLQKRGVQRGDRMLVMLSNVQPMWVVGLAAMKLGAVVSPSSMQLTRKDLEERVVRGEIKHAVVDASVAERFEGLEALRTRVVVGGRAPGWTPYED